jgi:hypothetical protein
MASKITASSSLGLPDDVLGVFLDWSFVNDTRDFRTFKHLWETGFFDENPITAEELETAHKRAIEKGKAARAKRRAGK